MITEDRPSHSGAAGVTASERSRASGRPLRARGRRITLIGLAVLGVLCALTILSALGMRSHLDRGRSSLTSAEEQLLAGHVHEAAIAFDDAALAFRDAKGAPGAFLVRASGWLPFLGRTPDALVGLIDIGGDLSSAGAGVARRLDAMPGGLSALGPSNGRLPIDRLAGLGPSLDRAEAAIDRASARADRLPGSFVLGPVATARDLVRDKLAKAVPVIRAADALVHELPAFAGAGGPVRYFVAPQNLAEARGTGGLVGNFAVLTMDHGSFSMGKFFTVESLRNLPASEAPAANPLYDAFGGGGFWVNLNMTPDVPTAATMFEQLYERTKGVHLDGTLLVDLHAMARMLEVTGPVEIKPLHATVSADNVVEYVASAQYQDIPWNYKGIGRQTLGPRYIAEALLGTFFGQATGEEALRALVESAASGHILLHSVHPEVQAAFVKAGVAGRYASPDDGGDFFGVIANNAAANKVDYYVRRSVRYEVTLGRDGAGAARAMATFDNRAPVGAPSYALGPNAGTGLAPAEDQAWTSFYCPAACRVTNATANGKALTLRRYHDLGLSMYGAFLRVKAQERMDVGLTMDLPEAWQGGVADGTYHLRMPAQPTIDPIAATVVVHAPPGMRIAWTSVPMSVDGSTATWSGDLLPNQEISVRFAKPSLLGAWSRLVHFLSRPAIHL